MEVVEQVEMLDNLRSIPGTHTHFLKKRIHRKRMVFQCLCWVASFSLMIT